MKSNAKSKIIILINLVILFALALKVTINPSLITGNNNVINLDKENLKISAVSGKIHIINNSGWVDFRNAGKCTGNGTYSEPYVIEDLIIDGGRSGSCILIENSNVYFKIENCTVYNTRWDDAGIKLLGVSNGILISNNASINMNGIGISLSSCNNNTISGNTANYNNLGIHLYESNNNTITGNTANYNGNGIYLYESNNNTISGNTANDNLTPFEAGGTGLELIFSNNNTVSGNTACNNSGTGISLSFCNYNTISGNTANNNFWVGISISSCNNITVSGNIMNGCGLIIGGSLEELNTYNIGASNLVNGKPLYYYSNEVNLEPNNFTNVGQVILVNCHDSVISNLNVSHASYGISLYYCNNNDITGNIANNNNLQGILLEFSNNNNISGNTANNNNIGGIHLYDCDYNNIAGNIVCNQNRGIHLEFSCNNNFISGNTANNNFWAGIRIFGSGYNTVSGNTANYNGNGISFDLSGYNTVSGNTANYNDHGIYLEQSNYNLISGNLLIRNQECIIEEYCEGNVIQYNDCRPITPSLNYFPISLIISITIIGVAVFIIYQNRKRFRKPQEDLEFL